MNSTRKHLLLIAPYGMCLRQILCSKFFFDQLVSTFNLSIMTQIELKNIPSDDVIQAAKPNFLNHTVLKIGDRLFFWARQFLDLQFLLNNNLGEHLIRRYNSGFDHSGTKSFFIFWLLTRFKSLQRLFAATRYWVSAIGAECYTRDYDYVLICHGGDIRSRVIAKGFNMKGKKVIYLPLGLDNLRHGPLDFSPDYWLLWGDEQYKELISLDHVPKVRDDKVFKIGSLIHWTYLKIAERLDNKNLVTTNRHSSNRPFILFPAIALATVPHQKQLLEKTIEIIEELNWTGYILVRLLPDTDMDYWKEVESSFPERIRCYCPNEASYDKSRSQGSFDYDHAYKELEIYCHDLKYCDMILTPYPSSVAIDGVLFSTPAVFACFPWWDTSGSIEHPYGKVVRSKCHTYPLHNQFFPLKDLEELKLTVKDVLVCKNSQKFTGSSLFDSVCASANQEAEVTRFFAHVTSDEH